MRLTPEQREAVQKKLAANILAKLNRGETITAREQAILDGQADPKGAVFVRNWDDLAQALGVSRRALQKWRDREDLRKAPDFPRPRPDGRHDVGAWLKFKVDHNLGHEPSEQIEDDGEPTKAHWDKCRARVDFERAAYNFEVEKEKHLPIDEITGAVGQMLAGFRTALNNLPPTAARSVVGLRDFHAIKHNLQEEVDAVLQALGRCDYLETLTADVVAKMFADRDEKFRSEIVSAADAAQRELGRLALADLLQRELPNQDAGAAPTPSDEVSSRGKASSQSATDAAADPHIDERNDSRAAPHTRSKPRKRK